jgi:hypothetical protein
MRQLGRTEVLVAMLVGLALLMIDHRHPWPWLFLGAVAVVMAAQQLRRLRHHR